MVWRNGRGGWAQVRFLNERFYQHPGDAKLALQQVKDFNVGMSVNLTGCIHLNREEAYLEELCSLLVSPNNRIYAVILDENELNDDDAKMISSAIDANNGFLRAISLRDNKFSPSGLQVLLESIEKRSEVAEIILDPDQVSAEIERLSSIASKKDGTISKYGILPLDGSFFSQQQNISQPSFGRF